MDIGIKIKNARINASLTQEQVAEALCVSRQTISNWETEKTYPDIISVVKMSDLYNVSLDHLLKEEPAMSNYLDYLEESTNVVNSKKKLSKLILFLAYFSIWAISVLSFWFIPPGDEMAYTLLVIYMLLPLIIFITSFLIGMNDYYGGWKWLFSALFGTMYFLAGYGTFSLANMIEFDKFNLPDIDELLMIPIGAAFSLIGMGIGSAVNKLNARSRKKQNK